MRLIQVWIVGVSALALALSAQAQVTSENNARLRDALSQFPAADADGDGILTETEARAFLAERRGQRTQVDAPAETASEPAFSPEADIPYGDHERHVFDFYRAESDAPTPLVIYWHGGGFSSGDKQGVQRQRLLRYCLDAGISVASGNYRLIDTAPFPAAMLDGARLIQFLRHNAARFNIDPKKIVFSGGSAGGNMSTWIAVQDDLADPDSADPVARESTRVSGVIGYGAQTFNDPERVLALIGGDPDRPHPSFFGFYGIKSMEEANTERVRKLAHEASAIDFVTKDDPPFLLIYSGDLTPTPLPKDVAEGVRIHHPRFGTLFQERYAELGLECTVYHKSSPPPPSAELAFLRKVFGEHGGN